MALLDWLKENLPDFLSVWISLNKEKIWIIERPLSLTKARLISVSGNVSKIFPPIANIIAKMVVAANLQGKGMEFHHSLFSLSGSITQEKLEQVITEVEINKTKLMIDIGKDEINNVVKLSSFLAMGSGARGTPAIFINEEFVGGYIPLDKLESMLK